MAPATLSVELRTRRLWLLRLACIPVWIPVPLAMRRSFASWCWRQVVFEYRCGGAWEVLRKPALEV